MQTITIDWMFLIAGAFGVAGILEYIKGFAPNAPKIIWRLLLPIACVGTAIAADGGVYQMSINAILLLAMSQLCYEAIIGAVKSRVSGVIQGATGTGK
jgi:hypothetical protein